jgi:glycerol uptake facilitator-like aquaporin
MLALLVLALLVRMLVLQVSPMTGAWAQPSIPFGRRMTALVAGEVRRLNGMVFV